MQNSGEVLFMLLVLLGASVVKFGVLTGVVIVSAVFLLMPWHPRA